jgi:hypothetical protein
MLTRIHITLLAELERIGIVEFYKYVVPNGTKTVEPFRKSVGQSKTSNTHYESRG